MNNAGFVPPLPVCRSSFSGGTSYGGTRLSRGLVIRSEKRFVCPSSFKVLNSYETQHTNDYSMHGPLPVNDPGISVAYTGSALINDGRCDGVNDRSFNPARGGAIDIKGLRPFTDGIKPLTYI